MYLKQHSRTFLGCMVTLAEHRWAKWPSKTLKDFTTQEGIAMVLWCRCLKGEWAPPGVRERKGSWLKGSNIPELASRYYRHRRRILTAPSHHARLATTAVNSKSVWLLLCSCQAWSLYNVVLIIINFCFWAGGYGGRGGGRCWQEHLLFWFSTCTMYCTCTVYLHVLVAGTVTVINHCVSANSPAQLLKHNDTSYNST